MARILTELDDIGASAFDVETALSGQIVIGLPPTVAEIISALQDLRAARSVRS